MNINQIRQTVKKLRTYKNVSFPVLSVYLDNRNCSCGSKLAEDFRRLLDQTAIDEEKRSLAKEIMTIEAYLTQEYDARKHCGGIALFASEKLWEIIHYDFPIPSQITITHHPYITPLLHALYNQGEDLVILADKKKARIYLFHQGILAKQQHIINNIVPKKIKANKGENYLRNTKLLHTIANRIHQHMVTISEAISSFVKTQQVHAIFIGGHQPFIKTIKRHLKPTLQKKVRGEFIINLKAPSNEIMRKSQHVIAHAGI